MAPTAATFHFTALTSRRLAPALPLSYSFCLFKSALWQLSGSLFASGPPFHPLPSLIPHSFLPHSSFLLPQPLCFKCLPLLPHLHLHVTFLPTPLLRFSFSSKLHVFGSVSSVGPILQIYVGPLSLLQLPLTTSLLPLPLLLLLLLPHLMGKRSLTCQAIWLTCWLLFLLSLLL